MKKDTKLILIVLAGILAIVILERDGTVLLLSLFFGVPMFFAKENWIMGGPVHESKESRKKSVRSRNVCCREKGYGHGDTATARRVRSKAYPRDRRSGCLLYTSDTRHRIIRMYLFPITFRSTKIFLEIAGILGKIDPLKRLRNFV